MYFLWINIFSYIIKVELWNSENVALIHYLIHNIICLSNWQPIFQLYQLMLFSVAFPLPSSGSSPGPSCPDSLKFVSLNLEHQQIIILITRSRIFLFFFLCIVIIFLFATNKQCVGRYTETMQMLSSSLTCCPSYST